MYQIFVIKVILIKYAQDSNVFYWINVFSDNNDWVKKKNILHYPRRTIFLFLVRSVTDEFCS